MPELTQEDSAHLIAAMCRLQSQGDTEGVKKLAELAKQPEKLRQVIGAGSPTEPEDNRYPPGYYMSKEQQDAIWQKILGMDKIDEGMADLIHDYYFGPYEEMPPEKRAYYEAELKKLFPNGLPK